MTGRKKKWNRLPENIERLSVLSDIEDESVTRTKKTKQMKNKQKRQLFNLEKQKYKIENVILVCYMAHLWITGTLSQSYKYWILTWLGTVLM